MNKEDYQGLRQPNHLHKKTEIYSTKSRAKAAMLDMIVEEFKDTIVNDFWHLRSAMVLDVTDYTQPNDKRYYGVIRISYGDKKELENDPLLLMGLGNAGEIKGSE